MLILCNLFNLVFAGTLQEVYRCFNGLRVAVGMALALDQHALRSANDKYNFGSGIGDFTAKFIKTAVDDGGDFRFFTVPLLLRMLELFHSPPANASYNTNVFLGADMTEKLESMTLSAGRKAAEKYRDTLIHIDDVPSGAQDPFLRCLLLRNIICHMGMPCLLSGTESTLLYAVNSVTGSRREGSEPWAWLLTRLPVTQLDEPLTKLTEHCKPYESHLLRSTRSLFVQWFARCHNAGLTETDGAERICMTPTTLTGMKREMCKAKLSLPESNADLKEDYEYPWLHASTLMVFADSLQGSGAVTSSVSTESTAQVGMKRSLSPPGPSASRKKQKIVDDVYHYTLLIRNHFALLHIPHDLPSENGMIKLHVDFTTGVCDSNGNLFTAKAAFKTCTEDPLLYLACLRDGVVRRADARQIVPVPSSYAFSTFREQRGIGNSLAKSNDGTALEAECMAAFVLAAHRYESFAGTPFFAWLALVVAELSHERDFKVTKITDIPEGLAAALKDVMVPLLSPPNSEWGESVNSGINFGNFAWCKNQERRDASAPLSNTKAAGSTQGEGEGEETGDDLENDVGMLQFAQEAHGYTTLCAEFKDVNGFEGENMAAVTTKVAENSISLLIGRDLCDWKKKTVQKFAPGVSVYRMNKRGSIVRVSPQVADCKASGKVLIALDLKRLHPGRSEALPHAT